jgi:hypothetical protein
MLKVYEPTGGVLYEENQVFPKWLGFVLLGPLLVVVGLILFLGNVDEIEKNEAWIAMFIAVPINLLMGYMFFAGKLQTVVTTNGFYYRWRPLQKKFRMIENTDLDEVVSRNAPSFKLGANWVPGYGWMHSTRKGSGLEFRLKNGKKVFIGTSNLFQFERAVRQILSNNRKTRMA